MFYTSRCLSKVILLLALCSCSAHADEGECPNKSEGLLLLQKETRMNSPIQRSQAGSQASTLNEAPASHAVELLSNAGLQASAGLPDHIVCHTESCAEVQATLAVIKGKQQVAKEALDECSRTRQQLQRDLSAAAKERAEAEKGLAKCASERAALEKELRQCAEVDRPNAEKALAQCAQERAKLEAELRQCAEVDRPAAEKGLAQCAKERAMLEQKLKRLAAGMKGGASASAHRRRRRRSRKSSLIAEDTSVEELEEVDSFDSDAERTELNADVVSLSQEMAAVRLELESVDQRALAHLRRLEAADARQAKVEAGFTQNEKNEAKGQAALAVAEGRFTKISADIEVVGRDLELAEKKCERATKDSEKVAADLAQEQSKERLAVRNLMSLIQEEHDVLHKHIKDQHAANTARLQNHSVALNAIADAGAREECDAARAEIITAKGKLEITEEALQACLSAKKEIKEKIAAVTELGERAAQALQSCLDTKANLKIKIKLCHDRRDLARKKLKECLDRKKVLKEQIHACHVRRDDARAKLKACLTRKAELKAKIKKLGGSAFIQNGTSPQNQASPQNGNPTQNQTSQDHLAQLQGLKADSEEELISLLDTLRGENEQLATIVSDLQAITDEELQHVGSMSAASAESDSARTDIQKAEEDETDSTSASAAINTDLNSAIRDFGRVGTSLDGAAAANEASGKQVDKAEGLVAKAVQKVRGPAEAAPVAPQAAPPGTP